MAIITTCACGKAFKANDQRVGKPVKCPSCNSVFVVQPAREPRSQATVPTEKVIVVCGNCGGRFQAKSSQFGQQLPCPGCASPIVVGNKPAKQPSPQVATSPAVAPSPAGGSLPIDDILAGEATAPLSLPTPDHQAVAGKKLPWTAILKWGGIAGAVLLTVAFLAGIGVGLSYVAARYVGPIPGGVWLEPSEITRWQRVPQTGFPYSFEVPADMVMSQKADRFTQVYQGTTERGDDLIVMVSLTAPEHTERVRARWEQTIEHAGEEGNHVTFAQELTSPATLAYEMYGEVENGRASASRSYEARGRIFSLIWTSAPGKKHNQDVSRFLNSLEW